jgi:hypothetical protein
MLYLAYFISAIYLCLQAVQGQSPDPDTDLVYTYVRDSINQTFREASGQLLYPYQVPGN